MICGILAFLTGVSVGLLLWQWLVAARFPLHQRVSVGSFHPPVTLLKPLNGADVATAENLRSWFAQDYAGPVQILFGVASEADPVCAVVRNLMSQFPRCDAQLVVCDESTGVNAKVAKLMQLEPRVKHDIVVVSDADVRAPPDLLTNLVAPFKKESLTNADASGTDALARGPNQVGLVTCLYRLAHPGTLAMRWEAIAVNADFWSQVLQARSLKPLNFALGAVMAVRRAALTQIGGFHALADYLADDYQLGWQLARAGWRVELCPVVVEIFDPPKPWWEVWAHQLRWARTIRVCQPWPYFFSILGNATFWPGTWLAVAIGATHSATAGGVCQAGGPWFANPTCVGLVAGAAVLVRILAALDLQQRLMRAPWRFRDWWLVPVKDVLQVGIWLLAYVGNCIEWRGQCFRLRRDGKLVKA